MGTRTHPRRISLLVLVGVLGFLVFLAAAAALLAGLMSVRRVTLYGRVARTLPDEMAAARRQGLPLEPADMRHVPPVADRDNAALIYRRICESYWERSKTEQDAESSVLRRAAERGRSSTQRAAARRVLSRWSAELRLAEQAAGMPACDFGRRYEQGAEMQFPEYAAGRHLCRLLAVRAVLDSEEGHPDAAFRRIAAGAQASRAIEGDHIVISLLARMRADAILDRAFTEVVLAHADRSGVLRLAAETNRAFDPASDPARSLEGELVMCRASIAAIRRSGRWPDFLGTMDPLGGGRSLQAGMCDAWDARYISYMRRCGAAFNVHRGDLAGQIDALHRIYVAEAAQFGKPTYELPEMLIPACDELARTVAADEARRRLRRTVLLLAEHHARTGAYPAGLSPVRGAPPDVFGGKPLRYRKVGRGFVLYSVGPDGKDNGGRDRAPDGKPVDIVVTSR